MERFSRLDWVSIFLAVSATLIGVIVLYGGGVTGEELARKKLFLQFLTDVLKVSPDQAEIDACKTEHLISAETTRKLKTFLEQYAA